MLRRLGAVALASAALVAAAGCARVSHSQRSAEGRPSVRSRVTATPSATPRPVPTATPLSSAPIVTPSAMPSITPGNVATLLPAAPKKVPMLRPNAPPQILRIAISETTVHPGDRVFGRVLTTSNVASVQARIGGYAMSLAKVGVGRFELTYTVAPLPWFVRGNFTMQVIARNTRGDTTTRDVPLVVR